MDPPAGYRHDREVKFVRKFELDDCDAELYMQRNGPKPWHWQRVLKMFPKKMPKTPAPVVVCPDYYIESIATIGKDNFGRGARSNGFRYSALVERPRK